MSMFDHFSEAVESVLAQSYDDIEIIIVVDGSDEVYDRAVTHFEDQENVKIYLNDENQGLLVSRNKGADLASGDIVAFLDDDAVADSRWLEELVETYRSDDVIASGGRIDPMWIAEKPQILPEEFYWLVGVTHKGFADEPGEVRNTFGSNISFRTNVFLTLKGFNPVIGGRLGDKNLQGGETELCARMVEYYGRSVMYNPDAVVFHKVFKYRTDKRWLLSRAFWQGYSKRGMAVLVPESGDEEGEFLKRLVGHFIPERLRSLVRQPSYQDATQLVMIMLLTGAVGLGYVYGFIHYPGIKSR